MSTNFVTRFQLHRVTSTRQSRYNQETKTYETVPAVTVALSAVKDPIFGDYTPHGTIEMTISNPAVVEGLLALWAEHVNDPDPNAQPPQFEVPFHHLAATTAAA